jgi:hypothetical protein
MKFALGVLAYLTTVSSIVGLATLAVLSSPDRPARAGPVVFAPETQRIAVVERELPPKLQMKSEPVAEHKPMVVHGEAARLRAEARKGGAQAANTVRTSERKTSPRTRTVTEEAREALASSFAAGVETPKPFVKEHRVY